VTNPASLWKWVDDIVLPGLYNVTWYNGQTFEYKEGFISNKQTFLMGMPRLRQLRIKPSKLTKATLYHQKCFVRIFIFMKETHTLQTKGNFRIAPSNIQLLYHL